MPFGPCNALATFERLMERVLVGLPWHILLIFLADVIVHTKSFEEVVRCLRLVSEQLWSANLKLSPKKYVLFQRKFSFLGHVVSGDGVSTDLSKTEAVSAWPVSCSVAEVFLAWRPIIAVSSMDMPALLSHYTNWLKVERNSYGRSPVMGFLHFKRKSCLNSSKIVLLVLKWLSMRGRTTVGTVGRGQM